MTNTLYQFFTGVDLHKTNSFITTVDQDGKVVFQKKLANDKLVIQNALLQSNTPKRVAVESTFNSYWLVDALEEIGIKTVVIDPRKTKAIGMGRVKTDKIDSATIAELNRLDSLWITYIPNRKERDLRDITRSRLDMVRDQTRIKNRVINIYHKNCVYRFPLSDMFTPKGKKWLLSYEEIPETQRVIVSHLLKILESLDEQIKSLEVEIKTQVKMCPVSKVLKTMPGIGDIMALTLVAEIGNIHRFHSSGALTKYAGIVPSTHSSGGVTNHGPTLKEGNKYIVHCLGFVAQHMIQKNEKLREFYLKKVNQKGNKKVAKTACMRKILTYIYFMIKENKKYTQLAIAKSKTSD